MSHNAWVQLCVHRLKIFQNHIHIQISKYTISSPESTCFVTAVLNVQTNFHAICFFITVYKSVISSYDIVNLI